MLCVCESRSDTVGIKEVFPYDLALVSVTATKRLSEVKRTNRAITTITTFSINRQEEKGEQVQANENTATSASVK